MRSFFSVREQRTRLVFILFISIGTLLGALQLHPHLGLFNDDAEYLVIGDALASGQGYTWANDPQYPPHNKYPPGYPLTVAGVLFVTGQAADAYGGIIPVKLFTLLTFAGALMLLWLLLSRSQREAGIEPLLAVGLFAVNPFVLEYAVQIMSELPYTFFSLLTLLLGLVYLRFVQRSSSSARAQRRQSWGLLLLLAILAALCYYLRGVGATLAISLVFWLLFHRQVRAAALVGGVNVLLIGLWQVRNAVVLPVTIYSYQFFLKEQEDPLAGTIGLSDFIARVGANMEHYILAGFLDIGRPGISAIVGVIAALGWLIAAFGWALHLKRHFSLVAVYTFVYLGVVFVWSYASGRFLIPVIPFLGYYGLFGGRVILTQIISSRATQRIIVTGTSAFILALILANASVIRTNFARWSADPAAYYSFEPAWSSYLLTAQWLRENLISDDVILARRHFAMYVYSGRLTAKYRYDTDDYEMGYLLSGTETKYVVEDAFAGARGDFSLLPPALESRNGGLDLVYSTPRDPPVRVWRLERPPGTEAE